MITKDLEVDDVKDSIRIIVKNYSKSNRNSHRCNVIESMLYDLKTFIEDSLIEIDEIGVRE